MLRLKPLVRLSVVVLLSLMGGVLRATASATLDGHALDRAWFPEARLLDGGNWTVSTGTVPNASWGGGADTARPFSLSTGSGGRTESAANTILPTAMLRPTLWSFTTRQPAAASRACF